jgi:hypothetical protein
LEQRKSKAELVADIELERQRLEATLATLSEDQMLIPGVIEDWTVKDILAHITVWEQRMISWVAQATRGEEPEMLPAGMTWDDLDEWNEQTYQKHRLRPLDDVKDDFHLSYTQAMQAVHGVNERDLTDPERFAWREGRPLWVMVAANTSWHYKEHEESIRQWLEG